jgi:glycosyltransferase involved in cell wall biosynthesis
VLTPHRVALCADFPEEQWPSMDRVANELAAHMRRNHADTVRLTAICPSFTRRATAIWPGRLPYSIDRALNRWWDYPRYVDPLAAAYDLFHIVDHSYAQLVHRLPAKRTVVTCHDLDTFRSVLQPEEERRSPLFRAATRRILSGLQQAAWITCDTAAIRTQLLACGLVSPDRVSVASPGVADVFAADADPDADEAAARLVRAGAGAIEILHVGSTIPRKRIDTLLAVCAALVPSVPDLHLVRVGGPFTLEQEAMLKTTGLGERVSVLPFVDERTLAAIYRRAAVVLQPSAREGFGLPVLEALACGTPVAASNVAALREVGGRAIEYAPVGDVGAWVRTVHRLLEERRKDDTRWQARRWAGVDRARGFTWASFASRIAEIYSEVGAARLPTTPALAS